MRWPDNGGLGESISDGSLTSVLGAVKFGGRLGVGVDVGDVDETRDVHVGRNLGNGLSNLDVDVVIRVVPTYRSDILHTHGLLLILT